MSRPEDISPDVWAAAGRALIGRDLAPLNDPDRDQICIVRAILAERERCASVAEARNRELIEQGGRNSEAVVSLSIAAAIRKGGE